MVSIIICKFRLEIYLLCCGPPKIFHGPPKFDFVPVAPLQCPVAPRGATWPPVGNPYYRRMEMFNISMSGHFHTILLSIILFFHYVWTFCNLYFSTHAYKLSLKLLSVISNIKYRITFWFIFNNEQLFFITYPLIAVYIRMHWVYRLYRFILYYVYT